MSVGHAHGLWSPTQAKHRQDADQRPEGQQSERDAPADPVGRIEQPDRENGRARHSRVIDVKRVCGQDAAI